MAINADEISGQLRTASNILEELRKQSLSSTATEDEFKAIKSRIPIDLAATTVDPAIWSKQGEPEQKAIFNDLKAFIKKLRCLNKRQLCEGACTFAGMSILLFVLGLAYYLVHKPDPSQGAKTVSWSKVDDAQIMELFKFLNQIEGSISPIYS